MAIEERRGYCDDCERWVGIHRRSVSHLLHALLSVVTVGIWLLVYGGALFTRGNWQCAICNSYRVRTEKDQYAYWTSLPEAGRPQDD